MLRGILLAIISACAYATLPIFAKLGYEQGLDAVQMLTYRFSLGAMSLAVFFLFFRRKALRATPRLLFKCAGLGIGLYMLQSLFFFSALKYIPASTTSLLLYLYPLVVLVLSTVFLKTPFRLASFVSVAFIMAGCCLVFYDAFLRELNMTGILLGLGAPFLFGTCLTISQVILKNERAASVALYMMAFAGAGYSFINKGMGIIDATPGQLMVGLALGVIPTAVAIGLLYAAMDIIGATYVSLFSSFEPAVTLLLAGLLLGETIVIYQVYGMILLIAGIVVPNIRLIKPKRA